MKTQTMKLTIGGALKSWTSALTLVTFLFVQLPSSFAQELAFEPQKLMPEQSIVSAPQPETPQIGQSSITAIQNAGRPLSLPANQEEKNAQPEVRGLDEYSFDEAIDQLQPGIASAVIVKKISSWGLRKLLELDIEIGIAVVRGKIVLFTSGEENQIRMLPAARELLRNSSVIAHTHPGGAMPSAEDFLQAGEQTEYVISNKGIYAYNHNGLIYSKPLSFGYLVGKLNAARKPKASTKETRDLLNEFIASMDEYNSFPEQAVIFRSADPSTVFPGLPVLTTSTTSTSASGSSAYITVDQYSSSYFRINQSTNASGDSVTASINFAATAQGPQNLSSFTKFTFQIKGQNDCPNFAGLPCARVEFVDSNNRVAAINLTESLRTFYQQLDITKAQLLAVNPSLDLTRIKQINFVHSRDGMGGMGYIDVQTGGLGAVLRSPEGYPIVTGAAYNETTLSNLPGGPTLNAVAMNGATVTQVQTSTQAYYLTYKVFDADDVVLSQINFQNPQNIGSSLTLAVSGPTARQIKIQVKDQLGRIANFYLNLTSAYQNYVLALSGANIPVGFDVTKITQIQFVTDKTHMGMPYNNSAYVYVRVKGLTFLVNGSAYNPSTIFTLPGSPTLKSSSTGSGIIQQTQTDSGHFNFTYNLPNSTDTVISEISWGQFVNGIFQGVPGPCGGTPSQSLIFAANGPAGKKLKLQLIDANGKISEYLLNLTGSLQNYGVSTYASALPPGFDVNKLAAIRFIADRSNMGTSGTVAIETRGLGAPTIQASTTLTPANIKPLPTNVLIQGGIVYPDPTFIAPTGAVATGTLGDNRGHYFYYETKTAGWAGTGLTYDNFSTPTIETGNLSAVSDLTFGLVRGNTNLSVVSKVKFEIVDDQNRKAHVYLDGIGDVEKVWSIPTSYFQNAGVDLTKVRLIYFIVEGQNLTGALQVNRYPTGSSAPAFNLSTANITVLPGDPQKNHVAPAGADSSGAGTPRGMFLNYTTGTPGWAGGGWSYDNFSTTTIETGDISQYQNLRFGLRGDEPQVKLEVLDAFGKKTSIYLHGIRPDVEQVWSISTQSIASYGVDLTKIRWIYFIVEGQNKTGTIEINKVPAITPSAAAITPLPGTPRVVKVAPTGVTANVSTIARGARLVYDTLTPGWAGAGFSFDDPATKTVESANLSSFSYLGFGLKGNPTQVKFELVDANGKKASVILTGISSTTEQRWSIPTSMFFGTGLDLTRITSIYFIVEGQNQSGSLEIYRI